MKMPFYDWLEKATATTPMLQVLQQLQLISLARSMAQTIRQGAKPQAMQAL